MVAWLEEPGCFLKAKRLLLEGQEVLLLLHCRCGMGRAVLWPGPSVLLPALLCLSVLQLLSSHWFVLRCLLLPLSFGSLADALLLLLLGWMLGHLVASVSTLIQLLSV